MKEVFSQSCIRKKSGSGAIFCKKLLHKREAAAALPLLQLRLM
jgi:hypothetical protein